MDHAGEKVKPQVPALNRFQLHPKLGVTTSSNSSLVSRCHLLQGLSCLPSALLSTKCHEQATSCSYSHIISALATRCDERASFSPGFPRMHGTERDTSTMALVCMQSTTTQPQSPSPSLTPPAPEGWPNLSSHRSLYPPASSLHFLE